ncbi:MAG: J domain-containing protein [Eubacterium sp.]|nr:J domain-containing protein [Eubacterium sp.]
MNPYQILGVSQTDNEETIKKAYRKAAKECHPDTHPGDRRAEERFKEISEAYRILSDRQKRKEYDEKTAQKKTQPRNSKRSVSSGGKQKKVNPMDVSRLFERYMGWKS